jgi:formylglycine-generating enzyme required for sulfatase activity
MVEDAFGPYPAGAKDSHPAGATDSRPVVHSKTSLRVMRGGSWRYDPQDLRSACRGKNPSEFSHLDVGFRLARMLGV